ncbi:MAG: hypothetical protein R3A78_02320 [Polyangiales bacterium]|nr:hypothetical protein [Myxococcales bacterium]
MRTSGWVWFLALGALLTACGGSKDKPSRWEADPVGRWLFGDFHVHATGASNDTGKDSTPEAIKAKALEVGLDFLVLTDHSNSTGSDVDSLDENPELFNKGPEFTYWDKAKELSDDDFRMVDGNELSPRSESDDVKTGHIGCTPMDLDDFDTDSAFIDRPRGAVTGGEALEQALDRGCFATVNHPFSMTHVSYDWTSYDYDGLEIWNGTPPGVEFFDNWGYNAWRCDLLEGREVTAMGGSDNHRVNVMAPGEGLTDPALGYPTTAVFAKNAEWSSVVAGLKAHDTVLFEGASRLFLDGYAEDGTRADGPDIRWLRIRVKVDATATNPVLRVTRVTACEEHRPDSAPTPTADKLLERPLEPGDDLDLEVEIAGEAGVYTAFLETSGSYAAFSQAIVAREN